MAAPVIPNVGPNIATTLTGSELFRFTGGSQNEKEITAANLKTYAGGGGGGGGRAVLTANATFYVATTGNDITGDGSAGKPWATPQHAWNVIANTIDGAGFQAVVNIADGTYTGIAILSAPVGFQGQIWDDIMSPGIQFIGNSGDKTKVTFTDSDGVPVLFSPAAPILVQCACLNCSVEFDYITFQDATDGCVDTEYPIILNFQHCLFKSAGNIHLLVFKSFVSIVNCDIEGSAANFAWVFSFSYFRISGVTTLISTPAFSDCFVKVTQMSECILDAAGSSFSGSATGTRFKIATQSLIDDRFGITTFPGNAPGIIYPGGVYGDIDWPTSENIYDFSSFPNTVSSLNTNYPPATFVGQKAFVTDGDSGLAWGATVINSGSGATPYSVQSNGTAWTVMGK
jgi:hypothetical protein